MFQKTEEKQVAIGLDGNILGLNARRLAGISVLIILFSALLIAIAMPASAAGTATQLIVFTDKKVYTDHGINPRVMAVDGFRSDPVWDETNDLRSIVYAIVLDDDGNIMNGTSGSISATLNDVKILSHAGTSASDDTTHHSTIIDNPSFVYDSVSSFNDDGSTYDNSAGDGINAVIMQIPDFTSDDPFTWNGSTFAYSDAHILLQINVTYSGSPTLTTNVTIMISPQICHGGDKDDHKSVNAHDGDENDAIIPCSMCHWGYDHLYNGNHFDEIPSEFDDIHIDKINFPSGIDSISMSPSGISFDYNTSHESATSWGLWSVYEPFEHNASKYCYVCHYDTNGGDLLDYDGESGAPRNDLSNRPSCSVASKSLGVGSVTCHATTGMEGATIPAWEPAMATSQATDDGLLAVTGAVSHNHSSTTPANVPCALCHGTLHNFKIPNTTATTINEQCWTCHDVSDGYINSQSHDPAKTDCKSCHIDATKLDSHLVPTAGTPGPNCTECHVLGGAAALHIDFDVFNNSNNIHVNLNNQSTTGAAVRPAENRICWACHGEDDNSDGQADFSEQPAAAHPTNYSRANAKNCTDCHNNAGADNFGAPQNAAHTWYDSEITTSAISECGDCHSEPEMYNTSHVDDDGITKASIASHYSTPHSYLPGVRGQDEYCRYCHQNSSTVFSSAFNNSENMIRADHSSEATTPACANSSCHNASALHGTGIKKPTFTDTDCKNCHTGYSEHNGVVKCVECHMDNLQTNIHPIRYLQADGVTFSSLPETAATCDTCHKSSDADAKMTEWSHSPHKVGTQHHSVDIKNGSKWGDYWDYAPQVITYVSSYIQNGVKGFMTGFLNMTSTNTSATVISENLTGSQKVVFPTNNNFTSDSTGWTSNVESGTYILAWDNTEGNTANGDPLGAITVGHAKKNENSVVAYWNASFTYTQVVPVADAEIEIDTKALLYTAAGTPNKVEVFIDDSSTLTEIYNRTFTGTDLEWQSSGLVNIPNPSTVFPGTGTYTLSIKTTSSTINDAAGNVKIGYDNVYLHIAEEDYKQYNYTFNFTGVPSGYDQTVHIGYLSNIEAARMYVYNTSTTDFEYKLDLNSTAFGKAKFNLTSDEFNGGDIQVRINDSIVGLDTNADDIEIEYMLVESHKDAQYPCEYCHASNKHNANALGHIADFNGSNQVNQSITSSTTWCQSCHYQSYSSGGKTYSDMVAAYPGHVPPEITGHATYGNMPNSTDGAQVYVDHTDYGKTDEDCFSCHGGNMNKAEGSTVFMHNVNEGSAGGANCTECHDTSMSKAKVDVSGMNTSVNLHLNLNKDGTTSYRTEDRICWGCHVTNSTITADGRVDYSELTADDHSVNFSSPATCVDCHLDGGDFSAPIVVEHVPSDYSTGDISTNASDYCGLCHNNSVSTFTDPNSYNPVNASASHYATNDSLPTGCTFCHYDNPSNPAWQSPIDPTAGDYSGLHAGKNDGDCTSCHSGSGTLHNESWGRGAGSGPDCITCHDTSVSGTDKGHIDYDVYNTSIHGGISTNDSITDPNEACWACHGDGSSEGHNATLYKNPFICEDCHVSGGSRYTWATNLSTTAAPVVAEHYTGGTDIKAASNASTTYSCLACHESTGEMLLTNNDVDANLTAWSGGDGYGSEIGNSTSPYHYGKKRTDLTPGTDAYCAYCHTNASAASIWTWADSAHNTSITEHTTDGSADVTNATTLNCNDCHSTGGIHDSTLTVPSASNWDATGGEDRCAPCHISGDPGSSLSVSNSMHNTSANIVDCGVCHNSDAFATGNAYIGVHSDNLTATPPAVADTCTECHTNTTWVPSEIREHTDDGAANISAAYMTCDNSSCHESASAHSSVLAIPTTTEWNAGKNDNCKPCHETAGSGSSMKVGAHEPTAIGEPDCSSCHEASFTGSVAVSIHTATLTSTTNTTGDTDLGTCVGCHNGSTYYVAADKIILTHFPGAPSGKGDTSVSSRECEDCHNITQSYGLHEAGMVVKPAENCDSCHDSRSSPYNATVEMLSGYAHDDPELGGMVDTDGCEYCHNNTNQPEVFHFTPWANGSVSAPGWGGWTNGTQANCIDCHYTNNDTAPFNAQTVSTGHRTQIGDLSWGIDDCYSCHTSAATQSADSKAMHSVEAAPADANCTKCHDIGGDATALVDVSAMNTSQSMHKDLNAGAPDGGAIEPYATESKRCWACHGNGTAPTTHPTNYRNPLVCEDCHTTESPTYSDYAPAYVTEHMPLEFNTSANVGTTSYCTDCHNNSVATGIDGSTIRGINETTAHYGLNDTGSKLMTAGNDSLDCIYCHMEPANNGTWGNAMLVTPTHKGYDNTSQSTVCYSCHNESDVTPLVTFHSEDVGPGQSGGPDCISCHDQTSNPKGVDVSAMNQSSYTHYGLNPSADDSGISPINKACWACHGNGTRPANGEHQSNYKDPYDCDYCHVNGSAPYGSWQIDEHYSGSGEIQTNTALGVNDSCYSCHNTSEMKVSYNAAYANITSDTVAHYSVKKDLGPDTDDAYCNYCHNNASTPFPFVDTHNKAITEHTGDASADVTNLTSLNCSDCHSAGRIHNSTLSIPAVAAWTGAASDYCAPCHLTSDAGSSLNVANEIHNTSAGIADCGFCHDSDVFGTGGAYINIHSDNLTAGASATYDTCTECHTDAGTTFVANAVNTHYNGAAAGKANTAYECEECHNIGIGASMHSTGMDVPAEGCNECHNDTGSTSLNSSILIQNLNHDNSTYGSAVTCNTCHDTSTQPANFHFSDYPNGTVQDTSWKSTGVLVNCIDCHVNNSEALPYNAEPSSYHKGTYGSTVDECYDCHTTVSTATDAGATEAMHNVTVTSVWDNCTDCHASAKNGAPVVDTTQVDAGIHQNLNGGGNDACTACHGPSTDHFSAAKDCDSCHINVSDIYSSPQVAEHSPSGDEISAYPVMGVNESCVTCHNNSEMLVSYTDGSPGTDYAVVSHYGQERTDMVVGNDAYCGYCHSNASTVFAFDKENNKAIMEHTVNTSADINNNSLTCASCHGSASIHNSTLSTPTVTEWTSGQVDNCAPCHKPGDSNATKYANDQAHDPTNVLHGNITGCGYCHNSTSQSPVSFKIHDADMQETVPGSDTCTSCHNGTTTYVGATDQIFSHLPNGSQYRGNTSEDGYECENCHGVSVGASMHSSGLDKPVGYDCNSCHESGSASLFNATQKVVDMNDYNHTYINETPSCNTSQCHNASGNSRFHMDQYASADIGDPGAGWSDRDSVGFSGPLVDCIDCHEQHNGTAPFNSPGVEAGLTGEDKQDHLGQSYTMDNCYVCHTNRTDSTDRYMVHNVTIEPLAGGPNCTECHNKVSPDPSTDEDKRIDEANLTGTAHEMLNRANGSVALSATCWACHGDGTPPEKHPTNYKTPYVCEDCHLSTGSITDSYANSTDISKHYQGDAANWKGRKGNVAVNCTTCHKDDDFVTYSDPARSDGYNVVHYGTNESLTVTGSSCDMTCHDNGILGTAYGNAKFTNKRDNYSTMEGICSYCHNETRNIIESGSWVEPTLHMASIDVYPRCNDGTAYGGGCHAPIVAGIRRR